MHFPLRPLAAAVLTLCACSPTLADTTLAPVSVTAKGYESDTLGTPASVLVADGDELRKNGANNLGEALRGQPGLSVSGDGAQGQNPVIRGLKKESVVLLVDGMRLNSAQPQGAIASFMSLGLAERVEIVKGPASVLYGTGALGGAVNVLLPQARFESGMQFSAGASFDSASKGVRGTGVTNFSQGDHALMVGASLARVDDYREPNGTVPRTGYDSDSFIGQYRFRIDAQQQLRFSYQQHKDEDVWYPGSTKAVANAAIRSTTARSPEQTRSLAEIGYSRKGSGEAPLNVDVRVYRQEMERQIWSWANGLDRENSRTKVSFVTDGVDIRGDWLVHPQHLVSFGTNLWRMEASPERYVAPSAAPLTWPLVRSDPFSSGELQAIGFYAQDDMRFGKLNVLAALRHDSVQGKAGSMANPTGAGTITSGLERTDNAFSGSLGAVYEVTSLLRPYANLAHGFRAGEMRERFESSPRGDGYYYISNPQIKPETSNQIEIGLKGASEHLGYQLSLYRNRITDYITGRVTGATFSGLPVKATENIGKATIDGFEAQARWEAWRSQWLKAGVSIVRGNNDTLNEPLYQMPADELSLGWEGRVAEGWTADVTGRFVARQERVATTFSRGNENTTGGFATADIGATWKLNRQHTFRVAVTNLFDRRYHEHLMEGISGDEIKMPGRSLIASWRGNF